MTVVICEHCQTKNESGSEQCVACGRPLRSGARDKSAAADGLVDRKHEPKRDPQEIEQWLSQLPDRSQADDEGLADDDEGLPSWLETVKAQADQLSDEEADELMDFLSELESVDVEAGAERPAEDEIVQDRVTAELPGWVAALTPEEQRPDDMTDEGLLRQGGEAAAGDEEQMPSTGQLPSTSPLEASVELEGVPERLAGEDLPEWLEEEVTGSTSELKADDGPGWPSRGVREEAVAPEAPAETADETTRDTAEEAADLLRPISRAGVQDTAKLEKALEGMLDLPEDATGPENVDQWLDILEDLSGFEDPDQLDQLMIDSDLELDDAPEWLHTLRTEADSVVPDASELGPVEEAGPLAGLRGILPAAAIGFAGSPGPRAAKPEMTERQRQQAALLRRLAAGDLARTAEVGRPGTGSALLVRTILGLVLLAAILLGWLVADSDGLLPWDVEPEIPPAAEQAKEVIDEHSGRTTLVAFEYTPAMAGELNGVASVILAALQENGSPILTISTIAAGVPMAEQATADVEALESSGLGYLPGEEVGLRALGSCLSESQSCETLAGRTLGDDMEQALADVELLVVLAADRGGLVNWIEQIGTQSDAPIVAGVTQAMGPIAGPYVESEQLAGLIEGVPDAAAYANEANLDDGSPAQELTSLTLAQWLVIAALAVGAVYFGIAAPTASVVTKGTRK